MKKEKNARIITFRTAKSLNIILSIQDKSKKTDENNAAMILDKIAWIEQRIQKDRSLMYPVRMY